MGKPKLLAVAGSLIVASLLAPSVANAWILGSASNCEAANLNQALQGIGWSQAGVKNNATTSFFVVCPLYRDTANGTPGTVAVLATFPGSTGAVECTVRNANLSGVYTTASFTINAGDSSIGSTRGLAGVSIDFSSAWSSTIVCGLDPGEGIEMAYVV